MYRALTPLLAVLIALGLLVTHVQPTFVRIKSIERETAEYANALAQADALKRTIEQKLEVRREFNPAALVRLSQLLPTEIDEIKLILSLDTLAREHDLAFSSIEVGELSQLAPADPVELVEGAEDVPVEPPPGGIVHRDFSFSVEGTYESFKEFLIDLEQSLTLFEIVELSFGAPQDDQDMVYQVTLRTFAHSTGQ